MFKEFYLAKNTDILIIMSATYHFFVHYISTNQNFINWKKKIKRYIQ